MNCAVIIKSEYLGVLLTGIRWGKSEKEIIFGIISSCIFYSDIDSGFSRTIYKNWQWG